METLILDEGIKNTDSNICRNIDLVDKYDRGFLSQNILVQLRTLVEYVSVKLYSFHLGKEVEYNKENNKKANSFLFSRGELKFLRDFHRFLQSSKSHYTQGDDGAERLMLKYYKYLFSLKKFCEEELKIKILKNIDKFPLNMDKTFEEYYEKIIEKIEKHGVNRDSNVIRGRYYVQKTKPIFFNNNIYYEITLTLALDNPNKFDRMIAFSKMDITPNYSIKLSLINERVNIFGKDIPIKIINNWEVSIRPCELTNFYKLFGENKKITKDSNEYIGIMEYLTETKNTLFDLVNLNDFDYNIFRENLYKKIRVPHILHFIDISRELISTNKPGKNVISYLLYTMNNKIIKQQFSSEKCDILSNLNIQKGCNPFEQMPFATALIGHNPRINDLLGCIDTEGRDHEFFARYIKQNTERKRKLYTSISELNNFDNVDDNIKKYNEKIFRGHHDSRDLIKEGENVFIIGYEKDTLEIIKKLNDLCKQGVENYSKSVLKWLEESDIDCKEKKEVLTNIFENSNVAFIYGAAGTGKTTLIKHFSRFFENHKKLYLANTHPAVDNLKRNISTKDSGFETVSKFLYDYNIDVDTDILIIDESSTISNKDMLNVLKKAKFKLLLLVGDTYQIQSILFGNWFDIAKELMPKKSVYELTKPYRSKNDDLQELWNKVRNFDDKLTEYIIQKKYSSKIDETFFDIGDQDEIILCLNYDGLYGINNINMYLQNNNKNEAVEWGINAYKVGDPILFNENLRFNPVIHNNLKGKIAKITKEDQRIWFEIEIDKVINGMDIINTELELSGESDRGNSIVKFYVDAYKDTDEDDDLSSKSSVPFSIAYAVSIHKAQGLEYESVKIIITDEVEDNITHNIFYTAITRARSKLKIYWSPECEQKIIERMKSESKSKDVNIIKYKLEKTNI